MMGQTERIQHENPLKLTTKHIVLIVVTATAGLLFGRVKISAGILPFGVAYILAAFLNEKRINPFIALSGVVAALCTNINTMDHALFHFAVVGMLSAALIVFSFTNITIKPLLAYAIALVDYLIAIFAFQPIFWANVLSSLIEYTASVLAALMFSSVIRVVTEKKVRVLKDTELLSVMFCVVLLIMGIGEIHIATVYLRNIAAIYLCMLSAYRGGALVGAAVSCVVGGALLLGGTGFTFFINLTIGTLALGLCKKYSRVLLVIGFIGMNAIFTYYENYSSFVVIPVIDSILAGIAFIFTPQKMMQALSAYLNADVLRQAENRLFSERFLELTAGRLKEISKVFLNASHVFSETSYERSTEEISYAIANIPERGCEKCVFYSTCWDKNFETTYRYMQKLYQKYKKGERFTERDLGQALLKRCLNSKGVIQAAREIFKEYELNKAWEKRVIESRNVLAEQLLGVSKVIDHLSSDVDVDFEIRTDLEDTIREALEKEGVFAKEIYAEFSFGALSVSLLLKRGEERKEEPIRRALKQAVGLRMSKVRERTNAQGYYHVRYEQSKKIGLQNAIAAVPKEGKMVLGDSHSMKRLKDGRFMLLISDGMGSGERAAKESRAVV